LSFIYFGWRYFGFTGLGIGFFVAGITNAIFVYFSLKKISSFSFTKENIKYIVLFGVAIISILAISFMLSDLLGYAINITVLVIVIIFCFKKLDRLIGIKTIIKNKIPFWN
jgi:O-antigen/teichoic acid export membrane protein